MIPFEIKIGLYNGIMVGFRTYEFSNSIDYCLYLPVINICLTVYEEV